MVSLGDFLTDGFPPVHDKPIRYLPHWQPIGDCGMWECIGCSRHPSDCRCDSKLGRLARWFEFDGYDSEGGW